MQIYTGKVLSLRRKCRRTYALKVIFILFYLSIFVYAIITKYFMNVKTKENNNKYNKLIINAIKTKTYQSEKIQNHRDVAQLVARHVRDVEVGRSSRLIPTKKRSVIK